MHSRTDAIAIAARPESFAFPGLLRSTEPEVFTFDRVPAQATAVSSYAPVRPRKRCTRVMYPAKVRMHLPPPEKSRAKRWLLLLSLVLLWQILTEEPAVEAPQPAAGSPLGGLGSELRPAEEHRSAAGGGGDPAEEPQPGRPFEQSARNSYVVALLVYHRLGGDK